MISARFKNYSGTATSRQPSGTRMSSTEAASASSARPISPDNHFRIDRRDTPLTAPFRLIADASSQAVKSRPYITLEDLTDSSRDSGYAVCTIRVVLEKGGGRPRLTNMLAGHPWKYAEPPGRMLEPSRSCTLQLSGRPIADYSRTSFWTPCRRKNKRPCGAREFRRGTPVPWLLALTGMFGVGSTLAGAETRPPLTAQGKFAPCT